jgi:hypothetical protein
MNSERVGCGGKLSWSNLRQSSEAVKLQEPVRITCLFDK